MSSLGVLAAGDGALDEHQVLLGVDADELEVLDRDALVTHVASHVEALADARGIGALADRTRLALVAGAVRHGPTVEVPTLDGALEALALGGTGDVDSLDLSEVGHGDLVAGAVLAGVLDANLAQVAHRLDALGGKVASERLVDVLGLDVAKADLDGLVAVGSLGLDLRHRAGACLNDGDGHDVVVLIPHLSHPDLAAENRVDHLWSFPSAVMGPCCGRTPAPSPADRIRRMAATLSFCTVATASRCLYTG